MMLIEILRHTPIWVFAILVVLVVFGLRQTRDRSVRRGTLIAIPCAMAIWSVSSLLQGFSAIALVAWVASYGVCIAVGFVMKRRSDVQYSPATRTFAIPGSWLPLILMMIIFFTRYALGIAVAMQPSLPTIAGFGTTVGAVSGLTAGAFAARAIRVGRSAWSVGASGRAIGSLA